MGELISVLFFLNDIKLEDVNIVGHSLGAQAAGFAGKTIQNLSYSLVGRITALDPAAPLFDDEALTANQRLGKSDARVVVVIHTDGGILGGYSPTGTIDFFPNGGTAAQPGCLMHDIYGSKCPIQRFHVRHDHVVVCMGIATKNDNLECKTVDNCEEI